MRRAVDHLRQTRDHGLGAVEAVSLRHNTGQRARLVVTRTLPNERLYMFPRLLENPPACVLTSWKGGLVCLGHNIPTSRGVGQELAT